MDRRILAALLALGLVSTPTVALRAAPGSSPDRAASLPTSLDTDGDGWANDVESELGSNPGSAVSEPESVAVPESCIDDADNDGDAATDEADTGCRPPELSRKTFPSAGTDVFDSTMSLDDYALATPSGICPIDFIGSGPTVIERSDPADLGGGLMTIDVEMVALQLDGTGILPAGSPCNPGPSPAEFDATIVRNPATPSIGEVNDTNTDPAKDFPADSFFDVFFLISTPLGLLPGGPPGGPIGAAVRVANTIRTLPPYFTPANPRANPNCYTLAGLPHQHCPKPPLDHFKCYLGKFPEFRKRTVTLQDQFGIVRTRVVRPNRFCNPVSKNDLPTFDLGAHLKRYKLEAIPLQPVFIPLTVSVENQFGLQDLLVRQRTSLFVPSQKERLPKPLALDHFTCYSVTGSPVNEQVTLVDQFDVQDGRVERPTVLEPVTLCAPTIKTANGVVTPVTDPEWHLVCYRIEDRRFRPRTVLVRNQFGRELVRVVRPVELCVPSLKFIEQPPPPPPPPPEIEVDQFPNARMMLHVSQGQQPEAIVVQGPMTIEVNLPMLDDADLDGLEQVPVEIVSMSLTGTSPTFGNVMVTVRTGAESPFQPPEGEFEENANATPNVLDVPPFAPTGTIDGFFHLGIEVTFTREGQTEILHTCEAITMDGTFTRKPPAVGEAWQTAQIVPLCNELEEQTLLMFGPVVLTPSP